MAVQGQDSRVDSLKNLLDDLGLDTARVDVLNEIGDALYRSDPERAIQYGNEAKNLAEMINYPSGQALALKNLGLGYYMQGIYAEALRYWEPALELYETLGDERMTANLHRPRRSKSGHRHWFGECDHRLRPRQPCSRPGTGRR